MFLSSPSSRSSEFSLVLDVQSFSHFDFKLQIYLGEMIFRFGRVKVILLEEGLYFVVECLKQKGEMK